MSLLNSCARRALLLAFALWSCGAWAASVPELAVYVYDSFMDKDGLGPEIFPIFERECRCKVRVLPSGDGAQIVSRLQLDAERGKQGGGAKARSPAQVVIGLDQNTFARAKPWLDTGFRPRGLDALVPEARGAGDGFVPFDYGVFSFMVDRDELKRRGLAEPKRLADLLRPEWKRGVILEDPRTSTPGLAFLLYANAVGGEGFWRKFRAQWLTLAPGWDGAYGLFLKGEAPLVWSYTTSQAYHDEHPEAKGGKQDRYRALVFEEGQPAQIEGAALVKGAEGSPQAKALLEFLLSPEVQSRVARKNWMYPVVKGVKLPESFRRLPIARKIVRTPTDALSIERALADWKRSL